MKGYFSFHINKKRAVFVFSDCLLLLISILLAYVLRYAVIYDQLAELPLHKILGYYMLLLPQVGLAYYVTGLYERGGMVTFSRMFVRLTISLVMVGMFNGMLFFFYKQVYIGRIVFSLQLAIFFLLSTVVKFFLILKYDKDGGKRDLLLVNFTRKERKIYDDEPAIANAFNLVEFLYEQKADLDYFLERLDKEALVVISSASRAVDRNIEMFISLKFNEHNIYDMKTFFINITGKIPYNTFGEIWTIIAASEFVSVSILITESNACWTLFWL